ncbi:MAG: hypothetical protein JWN72_1979 [Thermoleophilia bacterium]|nr:hypothetical protein [Thermoleophilia bacterium]
MPTAPATTPAAGTPAATTAVGGGATAAPAAASTIQSALAQLSQAVQAISTLLASQTGAVGGGAVKQAYVGQSGVGQTGVAQAGVTAGGGAADARISIPATGAYETRIVNGIATYFSPQGSQITAFQFADANPAANPDRQRVRLVNALKSDSAATGSFNPVDLQKLSVTYPLSADEVKAIMAGGPITPEPYSIEIPGTGAYETRVVSGATHYFDPQGREIPATQYTAAGGR